MGAARRSAKIEKSWTAWAGDTLRLNRLVQTVESFIEPGRRAKLAAKGARPTEPVREEDQSDRDYGYELDSYQRSVEHFDRELKAIENAWSVQCVATEPELQQRYEGTIDELNAMRLDWEAVRHFSISAPHRYEAESQYIEVVFNSIEGVQLRVSGSDPSWVRGTASSIESELQKGVPKWRFLRSLIWAPVLFFFLGAGAVALALAPHAASFYTENEFDGVTVIIWSCLAGAFLAWGMTYLSRRTLRGFEVSESGSLRSGRVLRLVGAGIAQVAVGLFFFMLGP